ncbi:MAG TPA: hypothetical protein VM537_22045 [Anaerolineae bacterium]|nr:hypothetical protein [Anaerolineae bacterium]
MKRTLLGLLALLLLGCGGGEAGMPPALTKLTNPTAPAGKVWALDWDPTDTYLAVGCNVTPFLQWYSHDGAGGLTKLTDPTALPSFGYAVEWDVTSTYLAVGHYAGVGTQRLSWYKRSGATLTKLSDPTDPGGTVRSLTWDSTGTYLVVGYDEGGTGTSLKIYSRTGDTLTKLTDPATQPPAGGDVYGLSFTSDDAFLAVGHWAGDDTNPFIWVYSHAAGVLTYVGEPASDSYWHFPYRVRWDPTDSYLAVGQVGDDSILTVYSHDGAGGLTKLALSFLPTGAYDGFDVVWHPLGKYLALSAGGGVTLTAFISWWEHDGDTFTALTDPSTLPTDDVYALAFSGDNFLAAGWDDTPFLYIYEATGLEWPSTGLVLGDVQKLLPLMNRVGSWRAQDFINTLTPFAHDPADSWEVANITDNPWWRAMAGYGNGSDGQGLVVENDIAYFIPAALPGAGARLNQGWFLHSLVPTDGAGRGFMNFTDSYFVVKPQLPTHDGVILSTTEFTMKPTWVGDTGKGSESVAASFLAEIAGYVGTYTFSFEYWDEAGVKQVDVSDSDTFVYDPSTMAFFRWRHDSESHTFYLEAASRCGGGGWSVIAALDLTQAVPMWGFMFDWYVDFDSDAAEEPPTPFAITFNPQPNSYRSVGCELWNIVDPVPRPGTMFATMPLLNTVAG